MADFGVTYSEHFKVPAEWLDAKGIFNPTLGHYVVIDVGRMGNKWEGLRSLIQKNTQASKDRKVHLIDGTPKTSASKL